MAFDALLKVLTHWVLVAYKLEEAWSLESLLLRNLSWDYLEYLEVKLKKLGPKSKVTLKGLWMAISTVESEDVLMLELDMLTEAVKSSDIGC